MVSLKTSQFHCSIRKEAFRIRSFRRSKRVDKIECFYKILKISRRSKRPLFWIFMLRVRFLRVGSLFREISNRLLILRSERDLMMSERSQSKGSWIFRDKKRLLGCRNKRVWSCYKVRLMLKRQRNQSVIRIKTKQDLLAVMNSPSIKMKNRQRSSKLHRKSSLIMKAFKTHPKQTRSRLYRSLSRRQCSF